MPDTSTKSVLDYLPIGVGELLSCLHSADEKELPRVAESTACDLVSTVADLPAVAWCRALDLVEAQVGASAYGLAIGRAGSLTSTASCTT